MTVPAEIEKIVCRHCYAVLDLGDNFCRRCGASLGGTTRDSGRTDRAEPDPSDRPAKRSESPWMMPAALILLLGPLALPMLWRNRRFPTVGKIILTAVLLAIMALIVGLVWYVFYKSLEPLRQLHELRGH